MSTGNDLRGVRVLIVEDVAECREALAALLAAEGAHALVADSGRQALAAGRDGTFDVVLADLGLPDIPGDVVIRELLATARERPLVVAMTGFGEPHLTRAKESGADVILLKPIDWDALRSCLPSKARSAA